MTIITNNPSSTCHLIIEGTKTLLSFLLKNVKAVFNSEKTITTNHVKNDLPQKEENVCDAQAITNDPEINALLSRPLPACSTGPVSDEHLYGKKSDFTGEMKSSVKKLHDKLSTYQSKLRISAYNNPGLGLLSTKEIDFQRTQNAILNLLGYLMKKNGGITSSELEEVRNGIRHLLVSKVVLTEQDKESITQLTTDLTQSVKKYSELFSPSVITEKVINTTSKTVTDRSADYISIEDMQAISKHILASQTSYDAGYESSGETRENSDVMYAELDLPLAQSAVDSSVSQPQPEKLYALYASITRISVC